MRGRRAPRRLRLGLGLGSGSRLGLGLGLGLGSGSGSGSALGSGSGSGPGFTCGEERGAKAARREGRADVGGERHGGERPPRLSEQPHAELVRVRVRVRVRF